MKWRITMVLAIGCGGGVIGYVYENDGDASFSSVAQPSGGASPWIGGPVQGSVADVDGDGALDVAAGGTVHLASGAGSWSPAATADGAMVSHFADMDGDCNVDLVTHSETAGLVLYLGDGTGGFAPAASGLPDATTFPPDLEIYEGDSFLLGNAFGIEIADLDGNGALDVARAYTADEQGGSIIFPTDQHARNVVEVWTR